MTDITVTTKTIKTYTPTLTHDEMRGLGHLLRNGVEAGTLKELNLVDLSAAIEELRAGDSPELGRSDMVRFKFTAEKYPHDAC